jgi:hypothetical protein
MGEIYKLYWRKEGKMLKQVQGDIDNELQVGKSSYTG